MAQRILTQLCRRLSGKPLTKVKASEFSLEMFPDLLKTTTLRLVITHDFCQFGITQLAISSEIPMKEGKAYHLSDLDVPPSCDLHAILLKTFWVEFTDLNIAFFHNPVGNVWRTVTLNENRQLRSESLSIVNPDYRLAFSKEGFESMALFSHMMVGALFALNEMPSQCVKQVKKELEVPFNLRDEASKKEKPLFNTVYLHKEFSDAITSIQDTKQKTLDISGRRFHFVRGHWRVPHGKSERIWIKFHFRGDIELGVVRQVYKAA